MNFPSIVYENSPVLIEELATKMRKHGIRREIEVFDLSMIHGARSLADRGLIDDHPHVQFVLGVKNALPAREHLLDILVGELRRELPKATWTAAGIGRHQSEVMELALARGAEGVRTGLEDNIRITRDRLARSNAELVVCAVEKLARHNARPARPQEARAILGLASA